LGLERYRKIAQNVRARRRKKMRGDRQKKMRGGVAQAQVTEKAGRLHESGGAGGGKEEGVELTGSQA